MKILLDTHILIWAICDGSKLSGKAKSLIESAGNETFFSIVSLWEIELKQVTRPSAIPVTAERAAACCHRQGYSRLALKKKRIYALSTLRLEESAPPHKGPFDRMLICQAKAENMAFVTHDARLAGYGEPFVMIVQA